MRRGGTAGVAVRWLAHNGLPVRDGLRVADGLRAASGPHRSAVREVRGGNLHVS